MLLASKTPRNLKKIISETGEHDMQKKCEIFLLDLEFIIIKFLLSNILKINFEILQIFCRFSQFDIKFPKNFLNPYFFPEFHNFSPISLKFSSNY